MSALTDLFTAMANKIRSKTGTQTTYTPLEMVSDGIDDVYAAGYDAGGGGGGGGIPITPSNASPVSLTSGESYEMQANGYAISSYTNLSPSNSSPVTLSDDTIYKTNGTGKAIQSLSDVTPSNVSPVSLTSGAIYKMGGAGKAVASVADITPSDSSPAALTSGSIYKAGGAGYAIASSPTSVTPSSSGTYFSSGIKKMASSGYAYSAQPTPCKVGNVTMSSSTTTTITLGFQPKYICYRIGTTSTDSSLLYVYDERYSTTKQLLASGNLYLTSENISGNTSANRISSITSTGFVVNKSTNSTRTHLDYFAIG